MTVKLPIDPRTMPDGVVLILKVRYAPQEGQRANPTIYSHAALKSQGRWYLTGNSPSAAGWGAVEAWLERDNRELVSIEIQTGTKTIWPESESTAMLSDIQALGACRNYPHCDPRDCPDHGSARA